MKKWKVFRFSKIEDKFNMDRELLFDEVDINVLMEGAYRLFGVKEYKGFIDECFDSYEKLNEEVKHLKISHTTRKKIAEYVVVVMRIK